MEALEAIKAERGLEHQNLNRDLQALFPKLFLSLHRLCGVASILFI